MRQQLCGLTFLMTLATWTSGCSLVQPAESKVQPEPALQMSMDELRELQSFLIQGETSVPTLDPKQFHVGQHVHMIAGDSPTTLDQEIRLLTSSIAGTVKEVSTDRVVLQDLMMVKTGRSQGVPVVSKVPYISRLFRNSGVGRVSTAVPGELTIEMSSILHSSELSEVEFDAMQKNAQSQRIGVDYDFEIPDAQLADKPVMKKQVQ